jgi:1,4-dihydroxy-2-naphthoate octaprenyltransferase
LAADPGLALVARWIALVLMAASILACAVFIWIYAYPWWMMLFAVLGNLGGWYYSAPPLRLSARGLGEICYTLLFGILVPAMGYLSLRGAIDSSALPVMVPLFFYSLVSILDVELPDLEVDLKGEKKTWVVRWGRHFGFRLIGILLLAGTACFFLLPLFYDWPLPRVFYTLGFLSFIPLSTGLAGWFQHRLTRERVTRCAVWILASLLLFVISVDAYLIWVSIQR